MVGPLNNGFQQQIPAANTFRPGEATQQRNPVNGDSNNTVEENQQTSGTEAIEETNNVEQNEQRVALAPENDRPNTDSLSNSSANRGTSLDITV